jgi:signal transduction histidine kinase
MIATHSIRRLLVAALLVAVLLGLAGIALLTQGDTPVRMPLEAAILGLTLAELVLLALTAARLARQAAAPPETLPGEAFEHDNEELESRVRRRTAELSALSSHLQQISEKERAALARELHDELGGLLIAVKMDVSWLHKRWPHPTPEIQARWARVLKVLDDGVDFKRRVVENLHPTLLDNMGLLPAVRWIVEETCGRAGLQYTEIYPEQEPQLTEDAAIMVFRLVQESLVNVVKHAHATHVRVQIDLDAVEMHVLIEDNGSGIEPERRDALSSHGLAVMRHRVRSSGGALQLDVAAHGGTRVFARLPLARILRVPGVTDTPARSAEPIPVRVVRS